MSSQKENLGHRLFFKIKWTKQKQPNYQINYYTVSLAGGYSEIQPKKNQDSYFNVKCENFDQNCYFLSVLDGHGIDGHKVSSYISKNLPKNYQLELQNTSSKVLQQSSIKMENQIKNQIKIQKQNTSIFQKLRSAFLQTNQELKEILKFDTHTSGSTCIAVHIYDNKIYCANTGDSRAILCSIDQFSDNKDKLIINQQSIIQDQEQISQQKITINEKQWTITQLSTDQTPNNQNEKQRIIEAGGQILQQRSKLGFLTGPERVWVKYKDYPGLAMTRSFADFQGEQAGIICDPVINCFKLSQNDKILVLASDGIWDVLSNKDVLQILIPYYQNNDPKNGASHLSKIANKKWIQSDSNHTDDITCTVCFLDNFV
ncbi:Protein phosphatase 2C (PP2C)-like domain [Pseudocohnilembus persalinus]|uniref:Protein phosphatase 2C (PP2C)-like domain n=1 Tax=Pseudocohnilembus persalinus TaxID=266149 RepID=A0A0V0QLP1_PSEPJ|nr:Protein phosphatase 2C (PP2C)-like domain [Pseudocohnilembus persalinus]|eukprot:KRX03231.1 Protein phosphatase 2C (PP2C)-like domain [Pseudocohnilembus persalinus]